MMMEEEMMKTTVRSAPDGSDKYKYRYKYEHSYKYGCKYRYKYTYNANSHNMWEYTHWVCSHMLCFFVGIPRRALPSSQLISWNNSVTPRPILLFCFTCTCVFFMELVICSLENSVLGK